MRTTITIDDDVFKEIESMARGEGRTRREVLNDALRRGIHAARKPGSGDRQFESRSKDLGRCLILSIDNVTDALAVAEGESFR